MPMGKTTPRIRYKGFYHNAEHTYCSRCKKSANSFYILHVGEREQYVCQGCIAKYRLKLPPISELIANAFRDKR